MKVARTVLLALALAACDWFIYTASPRPWQISGNGFHPFQLLGILGGLVFAVLYLISLANLARDRAGDVPEPWRGPVAFGLPLLGIGLIIWGIVGFGAFEATTAYYKHYGPHHHWGVFNQYTVAYWATCWPIWLGLSALAAAKGATSRWR